ncbi:MAG: hypothetical protein KGZ80_13425 [Methylomonas sp.]|nr:hypothetical protein [Methylomonas sp.]PPD21016.1 MAG: hypothetical protein CTY23_06600 [Methylomonas sp.]PPD27043.1 MAG: hypothetical protein CTY22_02985 [Methylomonas sp.]PPD38975.1 MAG: hypothetical protein CTY21_02980 [Methylomonas sp.]PPD40904.1 MAG: hypothetical protein CTY17_05290 [Methylomonas sp.]
MPIAISGLLAIALFATIAGWLLVRRKPVERPVKVMMFVGYFWLISFVQLLLVAIAYVLNPFFS